MTHMRKHRNSNKIMKRFSDDLKVQERMNLAFISQTPQLTGSMENELGREAETLTIPEFIPIEKIRKMEKKLRA